MTRNASSSQGTQSPSRTYHVRWVEDRMVSLRIAGSNRPSEATTRPVGSMKALIPDTAPLIVHRPTSIARS